MRKRHIIMAAGACLAAITLLAPTALADPPNVPPNGTNRVLAGAGSVITERVMNQMAGVIPTFGTTLGSWDGTPILPPPPPEMIKTKATLGASTCTFERPIGSPSLPDPPAPPAPPPPPRVYSG